MSVSKIKNMTSKKYPKGYHFYVIEDDKMYKIGYTKNFEKFNLTTELFTFIGPSDSGNYSTYNTVYRTKNILSDPGQKCSHPQQRKNICYVNNKSLNIWHKSNLDVTFSVEADVVGDGVFKTFKTITVKADEIKNIDLPESFNPKWIRLVSNKDCIGTAYFTFK